MSNFSNKIEGLLANFKALNDKILHNFEKKHKRNIELTNELQQQLDVYLWEKRQYEKDKL